MCKLNNVEHRVFGILIPKDSNHVTTDDLLNNKYNIVDYNGYWIAYGVRDLKDLKTAIEKEGVLNKPTRQYSIKQFLLKYYDDETLTFNITEPLTLCFIANILTQLKIVYNIKGSVLSVRDTYAFKTYLEDESDIPNLSQIIIAYGASEGFSYSLLKELNDWLTTEVKTSVSFGTIIKKPDSYELVVAISVVLVLSGYDFVEDNNSFHTNDDIGDLSEFITEDIVIYDKINLKGI